MKLTGSEVFTVTNGTTPPRRKWLLDLDDFEILCAANAYRRAGNVAMADALHAWLCRKRARETTPPEAA